MATTFRAPWRPVFMHPVTYKCIRLYTESIEPKFRKVIVCFDHFKYDSCHPPKNFNQIYEGQKPPEHVIALQVKFLQPPLFQNIGSIGYYDFTERSEVADTIKEAIADIASLGIFVAGTVSSGQLEMSLILASMPMVCKQNTMTYLVDQLGYIPHLFDPSWLLRKFKAEFCTKDMYIVFEKSKLRASYNVIDHIFQTERALDFFNPEDIRKENRSTTSAVKTFSKTACLIFEEYFDNQTEETECISCPEFEGTQFFLKLFDVLHDTFNTIHYKPPTHKTLRGRPVTRTSEHWKVWSLSSRIFQNMKFLNQAPFRYAKRIEYMKNAAKPAAGLSEKLGAVPKDKFERQRKRKERKRQAKEAAKDVAVRETSANTYFDENYCRHVIKYEVIFIDPNEMEARPKRKRQRKRKPKPHTLLHEYNVFCSDEEYPSRSTDSETLQDFLKVFKIGYGLTEEDNDGNDVTAFAVIIKRLSIIVNKCYKYTKQNQELCLELIYLLDDLITHNNDLMANWSTTVVYVYISALYIDHLYNIGKYFQDTFDYLKCMKVTFTEINELLQYLVMPLNRKYYFTLQGIQAIFNRVEQKPGDVLCTKTINCDTLHRSIEQMRRYNGLPPIDLVEPIGYGEMVNCILGGIALSPEFRVTVASTIFDFDAHELKTQETDEVCLFEYEIAC